VVAFDFKEAQTMKTRPPETHQELRRRAEEKFSADETDSLHTPTPEEAKSLLQELRVHQIELEMQVEELRNKQSELDTARARYFELYDLAPMGYLTFNSQGLIYEANLSASTMLGVTRKVLLHKTMSQFIFHEDQDLYYLHRKRLVETHSTSSGQAGVEQGWEMRLMRADGSVFWAHLQGTPAQNGEYWIVFNDISERRKIGEEKLLLEQQFQQAQKMESLGVLAGGIAHDFNNILAIIIGYCFLIKLDYETAESKIPLIEIAVERAAALCRQMLAYAGKAQFVLAQVDMKEVVDEMVTMLKATTSQNVSIRADLPAVVATIKGDASQLRQIVMNLIINASEAIGEEQGVINVSLGRSEIKAGQSDKDHNGNIIPAGEYICLEVTDDGCGMNDETRQRIFEPFYTTKFSGRGLGMSALLGIITAHKGALQLSSQPGKGTTFKVYLPAQISVAEEGC
jgi:PAS domain S-box-containing protein